MRGLRDPVNGGFFCSLWCVLVNYDTVDSEVLLYLKNYSHSVVIEVRRYFGQFCCLNLSVKLFSIKLLRKFLGKRNVYWSICTNLTEVPNLNIAVVTHCNIKI